MHNDQILKIELAIKENVLKTYKFTQDVVEIGRIPTADIFIDNSGISRQHTRIERSIGGPYIVKDMGSTNGTFLNDLQINEATLNSNDVISIGKFSLWVTIESAEKPEKEKAGVSPDDFDGTTVLSADQLAKLRAGIEDDASNASGRKPAGAAAKSVSVTETSGVSFGQMALWGGLILVLIVIGFFVFK